ncbi:hypothetical protein L873DRAFT_1804821 [Choiromyces venosus 120613-1]|uniref:Fatty acid hydroxylase domain-containing protein n=1 Tax=Choiromyces venosus 120613-1 TaxID=1336337 RepID=A0A3N4JU48_9PEZI|nr:hypothetical protein L873DRAFT_1804821 [Choiromyces venosus 120613-1]
MLEPILSITGLTLLYTSSLNSWSTSLNLLVLYLAWTSLLLTHSPLRIELFGTIITRVIFFWIPALFLSALDILLPSISAEWKIRTGGTLRFDVRAGEMFAVAMGNMILSVGLQGGMEWILTEVMGRKSMLRVSGRVPLPWELVWDLVRGVVLREILQYYTHRYLHSNASLYRKQHTSWQHSSPLILTPVLAHYDHPLPYLLYRFIPLYAPAAIFRFHAITYYIFLAVVSMEEVFLHTGFKRLFFSGLLSGAGRRNAGHFFTRGKVNYSAWGVLDWVHGTGGAKIDAKKSWKEVKERGAWQRGASRGRK